ALDRMRIAVPPMQRQGIGSVRGKDRHRCRHRVRELIDFCALRDGRKQLRIEAWYSTLHPHFLRGLVAQRRCSTPIRNTLCKTLTGLELSISLKQKREDVMAEIVFAAGAPHAPGLIGLLEAAPASVKDVVITTYRNLAEAIAAARADVLIVF